MDIYNLFRESKLFKLIRFEEYFPEFIEEKYNLLYDDISTNDIIETLTEDRYFYRLFPNAKLNKLYPIK